MSMNIHITPEALIEAFTTTSDGKLKGGNIYDDFILAAIEENTKDGWVDVDSLNTDFNYMRNELNKAQLVMENNRLLS